MSLFTSIKSLFFVDETRSATSGLQSPAGWMYTLLGGSKTNSGVTINSETALRHAAVYACCKVLAESVASLPLELFESSEKGTTPLLNDLRYTLLNSEPSDLYTSYDFRSTAMLHLGLFGNFYAEIVRDGNKRPVELRIIDPRNVAPGFDPDGNLWYKITNVRLPMRPRDLIHVKSLSSDGIIGRSPIELFKENIGLGIATVETQGSLWKNGTLSMGYLKHPAKMTPDEAGRLRETWQSRYAGKDNAGKTPVLENGLEYIPLSLKPADAMFLESARLSLQDICRIYRVPLHMVGDLERSTNNNIEHQALEFVQHTLRPILKNWEQELNRKLLYSSEKGRRFFRFNIDALLRGDTKSRAEYFTRALGSVSNPGWLSPNEVRGLENFNPVEGADTLYNPLLNNLPADNQDGQNTDNNEQEQEPGAANG